MRLSGTVDGGASQEDLDKIAAEAERRCIVAATVHASGEAPGGALAQPTPFAYCMMPCRGSFAARPPAALGLQCIQHSLWMLTYASCVLPILVAWQAAAGSGAGGVKVGTLLWCRSLGRSMFKTASFSGLSLTCSLPSAQLGDAPYCF